MTVHPIEAESYRILSGRVDLACWPPGPRAVVARLIHASADLDFATATVIGDHVVDNAIAAIQQGAPVVTDVEMVRAGITGIDAHCYLANAQADDTTTRSAAAMRIAAAAHPTGAVFAIGCAPTALFELVRLHQKGALDPAAVIGLPVGFVGAAESKEALRDSPLAPVSISNVGEKGGSAVAAAAVNALVRLARDAAPR
jgi:precorrin-8X/cobalt-precorrin-8 methylmutase